MQNRGLIFTLGLVASITLPFFNLPLMARMVKRRSSADVSLVWAIGVFTCLLLMAPAAWQSSDVIFKTFSAINITLFSGVAFLVVWFRIKRE